MAKFGRMEGHRNADSFLADTYGLFYWICDAEVVRVEISLGLLFPCALKGLPSGRQVRLDSTDRHLRGNGSFMYRQLFFTCAFHGPPSGIQVSLTHSLTDPHRDSYRVTFIQHQVSSSRSGRNPFCSSGCRVSRKCSNRQKKLNKIAMTCRKLIRNVVRPPPAAGWPRPWHARVVQFVQQYSMKRWSVRCLEMYWNLAQYAATLLFERCCVLFFLHGLARDIETLVVREAFGRLWCKKIKKKSWRHQHFGNFSATLRSFAES